MEEINLTFVEDVNGNKYNLTSKIGQGGQGIVYRTTDSNLAIKVLLKNGEVSQDGEAYENYKNKINDVIIIPIENDIRLAKPEIILKKPTSGYVMKLLKDLQPINRLIYDQNTDGSFDEFFLKSQGLKKQIEVLLELARTLVRLHGKGIVYCDISPNNVFYSDTTNFSNVWLIDCDNLKYTGDAQRGIYTEGYGAPEVVNNISSNTIYSDAYSFALLAFRLLTNRQPFEIDYKNAGSSLGWDATRTDINQKPVDIDWIFENTVSEENKNYFSYFLDNELLNLFKQTFSKNGRLDPTSRPTMQEWYETLKMTLTRIYKCSCGVYNFASTEECPFCHNTKIITHYFYILNIYKKEEHERNVEKILNDVYIEGLDEVNESMKNKGEEVRKEFYERKYEYPTIISDKLSIYNFNVFDFTTTESPYSILDFSYRQQTLLIKNTSSQVIKVRYNDVSVELGRGSTFEMTNDMRVVYFYISDSISKFIKCIRVLRG